MKLMPTVPAADAVVAVADVFDAEVVVFGDGGGLEVVVATFVSCLGSCSRRCCGMTPGLTLLQRRRTRETPLYSHQAMTMFNK